jgi:hypothetical protein
MLRMVGKILHNLGELLCILFNNLKKKSDSVGFLFCLTTGYLDLLTTRFPTNIAMAHELGVYRYNLFGCASG